MTLICNSFLKVVKVYMFAQNFIKPSASVHELSEQNKLSNDAENNTAVASAGSNNISTPLCCYRKKTNARYRLKYAIASNTISQISGLCMRPTDGCITGNKLIYKTTAQKLISTITILQIRLNILNRHVTLNRHDSYVYIIQPR